MCGDVGLVKGLVAVWDEIDVQACVSNDFRVACDCLISQAKALRPWNEQRGFSGAYGSGEAEGSKLACFVPATGGA